MGNKSCTIAVRTENQSYVAGSKCNGRIYLSVNDSHGISCQGLHVHFQGREAAEVHYTSHNHHHHHRSHDSDSDHEHLEDHYERNEEIIIDNDCIIHSPINGRFAPGQYEFPFEFIVPNHLPSTMYCQSGESYCEIKYHLKAYLKGTGGGGIFGNKNCSSPYALTIFACSSESQSTYRSPVLQFPSENCRINKCCCFNRGFMEIQAQLENSEPNVDIIGSDLTANTPYQLSFQLFNESTVSVKCVRMELVENITWKPRWREERNRRSVVNQSLDGSTVDAWKPLTSNQFRRRSAHSSSWGGVDGSNMPLATQDDNLHKFTLIVPSSARDSYRGRMIEVSHFLRIKVNTECCMTDPDTSVDVNIVRPSLVSFSSFMNMGIGDQFGVNEPMPPSAPPLEEDRVVVEAMSLPENWAPQTADLVALPVATVVSVSNDPIANEPYAHVVEGQLQADAAVGGLSQFDNQVPEASAPPLSQK